MRASQVLQRCLDSALSPMHALRRQTLLLAVESLLAGRRLVLIDLARSWLGAERIRTPLKRLDRLLSNPRLHAERERLYGGMVRWLVRSPTPVIAVDWCRLKGDGRWHLLRAAVPVGGRTLTLLEQVFPERELASPKAERRFLERLNALLPEHSRPILITDAGFRAPWCRTVERLGWQWITRLRHRPLVKPVEIPDRVDPWVPCRALYALTQVGKARDLGVFDVVRNGPIQARLVLHADQARGRRHMTLKGERRRDKQSRQHAQREAEPWLLMACKEMAHVNAGQVVAIYRRRMQIELGFRDLKSHRYGQAFEDSLSRKRERIETLLLLHALAMFVSWLAGMAADAIDAQHKLNPYPTSRRLYCLLRLGQEALQRGWLERPLHAMLHALRQLPPEASQNMRFVT
ncbi:IS4 family transposase [Xanthomonas graminis]|uniref:IS4 family transposase n=1 Tax=Xanthomonas graminis TaxID=3390026 RepID=UPI002542B530|nr:IS4 family transposase [Xanthomonas translucens]WIH08710.1 IS4 family transposase [Xanthomonas translucens pv. graminis]WIH12344.1 IS4 family transposase [Xanthomonas translucens pv. graminis]